MFTGLIEKTGKVNQNDATSKGYSLIIEADFNTLEIGESISINGVCLTLLQEISEGLVFDVSPETLACTNLNNLKQGQLVNIERAMHQQSRFGGHYVTGHVDCCKQISEKNEIAEFTELKIKGFVAEELLYLTHKGSITVDGVSLTLNAVSGDTVSLMLVPHTLDATSLKNLMIGDYVNIEFDQLAKMIAHQLKIYQEHMINVD